MFGPTDTGISQSQSLRNESKDGLTGLHGMNGAHSQFGACVGRPELLTTETETFAGFASAWLYGIIASPDIKSEFVRLQHSKDDLSMKTILTERNQTKEIDPGHLRNCQASEDISKVPSFSTELD